MEIESAFKNKGIFAFDFKQSFAYGEAEIETAVKVALKLIKKKGWSIEKVADVLELNQAELTALQSALKEI